VLAKCIPNFENVPNLWTLPILKHKRKVITNLNIFRSQGNICIYSFKVVQLRSFKSGKDLREVLHQLLSIRSLPFLLSMHNTLLFKSSLLTYCDSYWLVLGCARFFFSLFPLEGGILIGPSTKFLENWALPNRSTYLDHHLQK